VGERLTIHDQTEPVEDQGEGHSPLHGCGATGDPVATRGVRVTGADGVKNTESDSWKAWSASRVGPYRVQITFGDSECDNDELVDRVSLQVIPVGVILVQTPLKDKKQLAEMRRRTTSATYNLGRLEDGAQRDTDDENDSHAPMDGRVIESVKLEKGQTMNKRQDTRTHDTKQNQTGTADNGEKDGDPIENLFSSSNVRWKTVDVSEPSFREHGEDVECRSATADDDEERLVSCFCSRSSAKLRSITSAELTSDITDKHNTSLITLIPRLPAMYPQPQQRQQSS
jgi:hypothetical protein